MQKGKVKRMERSIGEERQRGRREGKRIGDKKDEEGERVDKRGEGKVEREERSIYVRKGKEVEGREKARTGEKKEEEEERVDRL